MDNLIQNMKNIIQDKELYYFILKVIRSYIFLYLNKISHYQLEKITFYKHSGYQPDIKNPQSFNEKIIWKKIYDRNPLLPVTADKYEVRSYIRKVLGEERAKEILIPLLYVTDQPETIPFESLPPNFIIKPNHASGKRIIVKNGSLNQQEIIRTCQRWLKTPYLLGLEKMEWAYYSIRRKIIIEELLGDADGNIPNEFEFHMFHGKCRLVYVILDKMHDPSRSYYDEKWNYLSVKKPTRPRAPEIPEPKNFAVMLELAEKLANPFDCVRVDLYNLNGKIYFGELTHYHSSGIGKFEPASFDFTLGKYWKIKPGYWKKDEEK